MDIVFVLTIGAIALSLMVLFLLYLYFSNRFVPKRPTGDCFVVYTPEICADLEERLQKETIPFQTIKGLARDVSRYHLTKPADAYAIWVAHDDQVRVAQLLEKHYALEAAPTFFIVKSKLEESAH